MGRVKIKVDGYVCERCGICGAVKCQVTQLCARSVTARIGTLPRKRRKKVTVSDILSDALQAHLKAFFTVLYNNHTLF